MTKPTKPTPTPTGSPSPRSRNSRSATTLKIQAAYDDWKARPYEMIVNLCAKHKLSPESLRDFMRWRKLPRPDGKDYTKKSDRQIWIEKGYRTAVKKKWTAGAAATWVEKESGFNINRGDIQYWAMKNDLPYLPETPKHGSPKEPLPPIPQLKGPGLR